tara:strand:+ start:4416 stop:5684 length:1269 start_codon:yes stop_codon:yes gene_type:complete
MKRLAFSYTLSRLKSWPIIETDNLLDYTLADEYAGVYNYVWLKLKNTTIHENFNLNWFPDENERHYIHNFPRCAMTNKKPISWNVLKLVPTGKFRIEKEILRREISSYNNNRFPIYVYSFNDPYAVKKLQEKNINFEYNLVKSKSSLEELYKSINARTKETHVWLVDIDLFVDPKFEFIFSPADNFQHNPRKIYMWNNDNVSAEISYPQGAVRLVPVSLLKNRQELGTEWFEVEIVNENVGVLNDTGNPFKAWARAFSQAVDFTSSDDSHPINIQTRREILATLQYATHARLSNYVIDGTIAGISYAEKNKEVPSRLSLAHDYEWLAERFRRHQKLETQKKMLSANKETSDNIESKIKRVYGEGVDLEVDTIIDDDIVEHVVNRKTVKKIRPVNNENNDTEKSIVENEPRKSLKRIKPIREI